MSITKLEKPESEKMMAELKAMIDQAEKAGQWLRFLCTDVWLSPKELRTQLAAGKFRRSVDHWELISPEVRLEQLTKNIGNAIRDRDDFQKRIVESRKK
jgi:hypothetical protein